ncbi:MAG: tryptophan 2,3-dioxygenase [Bdellovibrionales bacterium RIFCSPHIGHO2_01_FULL_40_29]|nr:MAG: tryptophan 2,3-dioxygenase [Bdellovibrionales bacterium RIFCSPHIGHO2_01_FULL_40_29]OFZ34585.1 MAG: tryptophan 2,3-dioxygenase [Bdellovibrionales bacterium RIFCSPHIGHO2_02_FULL_40_15]
MHKSHGPVYYSHYLMLDKLLGAQEPLSRKYASPENPESHEETLFIVVHQAYELWFKQILHDLDSVLVIFNKSVVEDSDFGIIIQRLDRITKIQTMILSYMDILETMSPMDFLEFRSLLVPASGFQSTQFREIEIKLGLNTNNRESIDREFFLGRLTEGDRDRLTQLENAPSLLRLVEKWLERMPFTVSGQFNFWDEYKKSIADFLAEDEATIMSNMAGLSDKDLQGQLENLKITRETFSSLFDVELHQKIIELGQRKLSQKAILNALFILLYRHEPMLTLPQQMITLMMNIDENFTTWRQRHALMAHRMLGTKIGTGGSSGHQYLKRAADSNRVFMDLFNLSTYLLPSSRLPVIPTEVRRQLNFHV